MTKRNFGKDYKTPRELVTLLENRGLIINDRQKAQLYLESIGYYRLSAYMHPLLKTPKILHLYKEGATFNKVMMLYRFDKKLRLLLFNEIEKIEIAVREAVMNMTAERTGDIYIGLQILHIFVISPFSSIVWQCCRRSMNVLLKTL